MGRKQQPEQQGNILVYSVDNQKENQGLPFGGRELSDHGWYLRRTEDTKLADTYLNACPLATVKAETTPVLITAL